MTVMERRSQSDRILVVGGYGYGNVGDEAILAGLLARLSARGAREQVTVVSRDPAQTRAMHDVDAVPIAQAVPELRRHGCVLIGGGGLFGPHMGKLGRLLPAFGLVASAAGRRVTVEGVDLEVEASRPRGLLLTRLLRAADRVAVRDRASAGLLAEWGIDAHVRPDLSAWMEPASAQDGRGLLEEAGVLAGRPVVGLALTAVNRALVEPMLAAVTDAMDALPEIEFCFIPMSRHPSVPAHDDLRLARRLRDARPRVRVVEGAIHPSVVLAAFGHLSAMVAMRYHAMLFAERAGVPLLPVPYAEKNRRWLAERHRSAVEAGSRAITAGLQLAVATEPRLRVPS